MRLPQVSLERQSERQPSPERVVAVVADLAHVDAPVAAAGLEAAHGRAAVAGGVVAVVAALARVEDAVAAAGHAGVAAAVLRPQGHHRRPEAGAQVHREGAKGVARAHRGPGEAEHLRPKARGLHGDLWGLEEVCADAHVEPSGVEGHPEGAADQHGARPAQRLARELPVHAHAQGGGVVGREEQRRGVEGGEHRAAAKIDPRALGPPLRRGLAREGEHERGGEHRGGGEAHGRSVSATAVRGGEARGVQVFEGGASRGQASPGAVRTGGCCARG
jgi:hypothetical protein